MVKSEFRKRKNKFAKSDLFFIGLIILLVLLGRAVIGVYKKEKTSGEILEQKRAEYEELQERKENLESEIEALSTPRGVEEEIREKFGMVRSGEEVIFLVDNPSTTTLEEKGINKGFFEKILNFLGFE